MKVEAPERIWVWPDTIDDMGSSVNRDEIIGYVEYVRIDKLEELAAALAECDKEIAALREAAREAVNCITHHAEDNENTRWVLSLLNTALAQGGQR